MRPRSAGLLLYDRSALGLQVLLVHLGGPFFRNKWTGAWQIPKGEIEPAEDPCQAALREFAEEVGPPPPGKPEPLGTIRQAGGKLVEAFALAGRFDTMTLSSNSFSIEWPPRSGRRQSFPEVDAASWFAIEKARAEILPSQAPLLDRLEALLPP